MTTICGKKINDTGEHILKIIFFSISAVVFLIGLIISLVEMHNTKQPLFAAGIIVSFIGIMLGMCFCLSTRCSECRKNNYESIPNYPSSIV